MPAQEDIWSRIDHEMVEARLGQGQLHLHAEMVARLRQMLEQRLQQGYAGPTLREVLVVVAEYLGRQAELAYEVYEGVWKLQGHELTPDFIRTAYRRAIAPTLDAGIGSSVSFAEQAIVEMRIRHFSNLIPRDFITEKGRLLEEFWRRKSVIDAKELEYAAESNPPLLKSRRGRKAGYRFPETLKLEEEFRAAIDTLGRAGNFKPGTKAIVEELVTRQLTELGGKRRFPCNYKKKAGLWRPASVTDWLRGHDLNVRPSGYETELSLDCPC